MFTIFLLLPDIKIDYIILDTKDRIEACNLRISKQRIHHYNVAKLGCITCLLIEIEIIRWTEFLQEQVEDISHAKVMFAISIAKINDGTRFKDDSASK